MVVRPRMIWSRPRHDSTAITARIAIATSISISVKPRSPRARRTLRASRLKRTAGFIRHNHDHLREIAGDARRLHDNFHPPENRIRRRRHAVGANQLEIALRAIERPRTDLRPCMREPQL